MFSIWKSWLNQLWHLSDEDLVALVDGELSARADRRARRHLHNCWSCRLRVKRTETAISAFMHDREELYKREASGKPDWHSFSTRLARISNKEVTKEKVWGERWSSVGWASAAVAGVLAGVIWLSIASVPAASARTILARAREAERAFAGQSTDRVLHRKLSVERRSQRTGKQVRESVEYWHHAASGRDRTEGGDILWGELSTALRTYPNDDALLSAAGFERWWSTVGATEDSTDGVVLADGARAIEIRVRRLDSRHDGIIENRLSFREGNWCPVRQRLWVKIAGDVVEYDLRAETRELVSYAVAASHLAPPSVLASKTMWYSPVAAPVTALEIAPRPETQPLKEFVTADSLLTAEVEARFALHRLEVCLGEPVEVERNESEGLIVVKGLVSHDERRRQLIASLKPIEHVSVRLTTLEEAMRSAIPTPGVEQGRQVQAEQVKSRSLAVERLLRPLGPMQSAPQNLVRTANLAVDASSCALLHAFALERLADAFPAETVTRLKPASRWLVETMVRSHVGVIYSESRQLSEILAPVFTAVPRDEATQADFGSEVPWRAAAHILVVRLRETDKLVQILFTASPPSGVDALEAAARLHEELIQTDHQAQHIEARIPVEFGGTVASIPGRGTPPEIRKQR